MEPLKEPRVLQTIEAKLKVLDYYEELRRDKRRATEILCAPRKAAKTAQARQAIGQSRAWAIAVKKRNLQALCKEKFVTLGNSKVCKWAATARREGWRDMPAMLRAKAGA